MKKENRIYKQQWIINKKFQFSFLKYFIMLIFLQILMQMMLIQYFDFKFSSMLANIGMTADDPIYNFFQTQSVFLLLLSVGIGFVSTVILLFVGLRLSHRVAGPIHRAVSYLNQSSNQGNLKFREGDYFPELAEAINSYHSKMRSGSGK